MKDLFVNKTDVNKKQYFLFSERDTTAFFEFFNITVVLGFYLSPYSNL